MWEPSRCFQVLARGFHGGPAGSRVFLRGIRLGAGHGSPGWDCSPRSPTPDHQWDPLFPHLLSPSPCLMEPLGP